MTDQTVNFIAGLPRSGSTLLAALLRQNPAFHADITSPVCLLISGFLEQTSADSEFATSFDADARKRICRSVFDAYYQPHAEKRVIFDTNRLWPARLHQAVELFEPFKVICCVRNPAWVMDSFERIYRRNPFVYSKMFTPQNRQTVYSRCEALAAGNGALGVALAAMREAYYGEYSNRLLLIDYDLLAQHPKKTMTLLYRFLGYPEFEHDFDNVEYAADEFDRALGVEGLHNVKRQVRLEARPTILPPDLFAKYSELEFWTDAAGTSASFIAEKKQN